MTFDKKKWEKQYNQTPKGKKRRIIAQWKSRGLIGNYDMFYFKVFFHGFQY